MLAMNLFFYFTFILFGIIQQAQSESINKCAESINKIENKYKIPNKLLRAISLTESGRTIDKQFVAWPWSVNVSGKSFYFNDKASTLLFLKKKVKYQKNIDIGCMQINFKYHNEQFKDLNTMLDPVNNIDWAAKYLKKLYNRHKSWNIAVSRYHSSNPERMKKYLEKVIKNWKEEREKKNIYAKNVYIKKPVSIKQLNKIYLKKNEEKILFFRKEFEKKKL